MVTRRRPPGSPAPCTPPEQRGGWSRHRRRCPIHRCRKPPRGPRCVSSCLPPVGAESSACPAPAAGRCTAPVPQGRGSPAGSRGVRTGRGPVLTAPTGGQCSGADAGWPAFWWELMTGWKERGAVINISWLPSQLVLHNGSYCLLERNQTEERLQEGTLKRLSGYLALPLPLWPSVFTATNISPIKGALCSVREDI